MRMNFVASFTRSSRGLRNIYANNAILRMGPTVYYNTRVYFLELSRVIPNVAVQVLCDVSESGAAAMTFKVLAEALRRARAGLPR